MPNLTVGARTSPLAVWQTQYVIDRLCESWPGLVCVVRSMTTQGDRTQAQGLPLPAIGGKGLFTQELEEALRSGEIDLAVHSLKDLPVDDAPGLVIGAITRRADVRDALVARNGWTLATLPPGAVVGTSSTRRAAQLLAARPDLALRSIRGNVETRIRKVRDGDYDATVLAAAGLTRLGLADVVTEWLPLAVMLPAPGQGALAVQCRGDDEALLQLLAAIDDPDTRTAVIAERSFLHKLGGGCAAPVAAYARPLEDKPAHLRLTGLVAAPDGRAIIRVEGDGDLAAGGHVLGARLAAQALAQGAADLLREARTPTAAMTAPLRGKRVVITRTGEQAADWAARLAQLGAEPLVMPAIRIAPLPDLGRLDDALAELAAYDWLVLTSANAVAVVAERLRLLGEPQELLRGVAIAAIGPATADAVRKLGVAPAFVPEEHGAEALAATLPAVADRRILLPQAAAARPTLAEQLAARGAAVEAIPIYDTEPVALDEASLGELARGVDAVVFTSGSTVRSFVASAREHEDAARQVAAAAVVCIGPATAEAAQAAGLCVVAVATEASVNGVVEALTAQFGSDPARGMIL